jgi:hypothetical protein
MKRRRSQSRDETVYYVFEIKEWDWERFCEFGVLYLGDRR